MKIADIMTVCQDASQLDIAIQVADAWAQRPGFAVSVWVGDESTADTMVRFAECAWMREEDFTGPDSQIALGRLAALMRTRHGLLVADSTESLRDAAAKALAFAESRGPDVKAVLVVESAPRAMVGDATDNARSHGLLVVHVREAWEWLP